MEISPVSPSAPVAALPQLVVARPEAQADDREAAAPQVAARAPDQTRTPGLNVSAHMTLDEASNTNVLQFRDKRTGEVLYTLPPPGLLEQTRDIVEARKHGVKNP